MNNALAREQTDDSLESPRFTESKRTQRRNKNTHNDSSSTLQSKLGIMSRNSSIGKGSRLDKEKAR